MQRRRNTYDKSCLEECLLMANLLYTKDKDCDNDNDSDDCYSIY